jgi:hypothetical protein
VVDRRRRRRRRRGWPRIRWHIACRCFCWHFVFILQSNSDAVPIRTRIQELLTFVHANVERRDVAAWLCGRAQRRRGTVLSRRTILFEICSPALPLACGALCCAWAWRSCLAACSASRSVARCLRAIHAAISWTRMRAGVRCSTRSAPTGSASRCCCASRRCPRMSTTMAWRSRRSPMRTFSPPRLVGSLPFILNNVVIGSMARSLESTLSGSAASDSDPAADLRLASHALNRAHRALWRRRHCRHGAAGASNLAVDCTVGCQRSRGQSKTQNNNSEKKTKSPSPPRRRTRSMSPARSRR